ncbi:N(5)-(carboxyethyl)ornithine synthase [Ruminococcus sp.]|uniref:N(5)-(carboxyethyl)ornithine synthase n=1 Tax=Ruminococcus sp. TaxID=41978 RepID=UPI0025E5A3B9|nr:N(5)-(carboxyethyl)ornithine synthase [Ruminococcus sp.]
MKTVGFPISHKENEKRRAIVPKDISRITNPNMLFIEEGFGEVLGISDSEYISMGCNVASHDLILQQDIICDPKVGDADYLNKLNGQTVFGWVHATQNRHITDIIISNKITAYAWEKMFQNGRHVFWFNNELAGEAAVINAFQCYGMLPFGLNVAVIGNGNTARGAIRVLNMLGAKVMQYNRRTEKLLQEEIGKYDVIVNCVLWDVQRNDHIIYRSDLRKMKKGALIIDVSCDHDGAIESSHPTTIEEPTYVEEGILHYSVDHTPAIFYKTFSYQNSMLIIEYLNDLITENYNEILSASMIVNKGAIVDEEIIKYQGRSGRAVAERTYSYIA